MRIFICMHYMELGGSERALLGLLEAFTHTNHHVDIFVYSHQGELMNHIPAGIKLLPEISEYACYEKPIVEVFKQGHFTMGCARIWAKISELIHNKHTNTNLLASSIADEMGRATCAVLPNLHYLGEYDIAISFLNPHYYLIHKVKAKTKIGWFHTDYGSISINAQRELPMWEKLDYIIAVSNESREAFLKKFPQLTQKTKVIENILPYHLIKEQAEVFDAAPEMPGNIKLLSIGRFGPAKNFPWAVEVMAQLCKVRDDVVWYIIGYGGGEQEILDAIAEYKMKDRFILLGKKSNPYPYIKACDVYVQPSIFEGRSVTVQEAQFLSKPVIITNYPSANSQVTEGVDGFIIPLEDAKKAASAINDLLNDTASLDKIAKNAKNKDYSGRKYINQIISLSEK